MCMPNRNKATQEAMTAAKSAADSKSIEAMNTVTRAHQKRELVIQQ